MITQISTRRATLVAIVLTAMLALLFSTEFGPRRTRISAQDLALMRGANLNTSTKNVDCSTTNGISACTQETVGKSCNSCDQNSYVDTINGLGQYARGTGAAQSCGLNYPGVCRKNMSVGKPDTYDCVKIKGVTFQGKCDKKKIPKEPALQGVVIVTTPPG